MADLDYTQPVSALLRQATMAAHSTAEHSPGAGWLARGELDREEYIRFNFMLWAVYSTLEDALATHSTHSVLVPTYNPAVLARTPRLEADIAHLLEATPPSQSPAPSVSPESEALLPATPPAWCSHPLYRAFLASPPPAITSYVARLRALSSSAQDSALLLAHSYVRYLGDLSGGQVIRRRVAKAYDLDESSTSFYSFIAPGSSDRDASIGDMKHIKETFRAGMDEGVLEDEELKRRLAAEANTAFALNTGLFDALQPPTDVKAKHALEINTDAEPQAPTLGVPLSPPASAVFAGLSSIGSKVADLFGTGRAVAQKA